MARRFALFGGKESVHRVLKLATGEFSIVYRLNKPLRIYDGSFRPCFLIINVNRCRKDVDSAVLIPPVETYVWMAGPELFTDELFQGFDRVFLDQAGGGV